MPRFSREPLERMISLRVTRAQDEYLGALARALGLAGGKAELLRKALDFWLRNAPEALRAAKGAGPAEGEA